MVDDVEARRADTVGLVEAIHGSLAAIDADNRAITEIENFKRQPDQEEDDSLDAEKVPCAFSGEEEEEATARMMKQKGKRVMQFGMSRDKLRQNPDGKSQEDRIECVACQDNSAGNDQNKIVMAERYTSKHEAEQLDVTHASYSGLRG